MIKKVNRKEVRVRKHVRVRKKISGTAECPRLAVFRSASHIYAQIIDDDKGVTLVAASTLDKAIKEKISFGGNVEAAKEVCRNTRGPVASIFYQGLSRADEGVDVVEKSVVSYGGVQMSQLESGLSWIQLFITTAPSLGFLGTVLGMIAAFDAIEVAGDISPNIVAGGMKVALITTVGGLIVAIILQFFYNYIVSKIDSIVLSMEDASISLVDLVVKYVKK